MATSKSFFTIRRGSTKSLTFSSYRGKQVTKDRVTEVANPQSMAQMLQRAKLIAVSQYSAALKSIIDHSFQGVDYGYKSIAEFRKANLAADSPMGIVNLTPKGYKNMSIATPLVSNGSLVAPEITPIAGSDTVEENNLVQVGLSMANLAGTVAEPGNASWSETNIQDFLEENGWAGSMQITVLVQVADGSGVEYSDGHFTFPSKFYVERFIFNTDDPSLSTFGWGSLSDSSWPGIYYGDLYGSYIGICRDDDNNRSLLYANILNTQNEVLPVLGYAVILSKEVDGVYQRSRSQMVVTNLASQLATDTLPQHGTKTAINAAIETYINSANSSQAYLNEGSDTTSLATV